LRYLVSSSTAARAAARSCPPSGINRAIGLPWRVMTISPRAREDRKAGVWRHRRR
jgi:hypothetical protein